MVDILNIRLHLIALLTGLVQLIEFAFKGKLPLCLLLPVRFVLGLLSSNLPLELGDLLAENGLLVNLIRVDGTKPLPSRVHPERLHLLLTPRIFR